MGGAGGLMSLLQQNPMLLALLFGMGSGGADAWNNAIYPSLASMFAGAGASASAPSGVSPSFTPQGASPGPGMDAAGNPPILPDKAIFSPQPASIVPAPGNPLTGGGSAPIAAPAAMSAPGAAIASAPGASAPAAYGVGVGAR